MARISLMLLLIILSYTASAIGPAPVVVQGMAPSDGAIEAVFYHEDGRIETSYADTVDVSGRRFYRCVFTVDDGTVGRIAVSFNGQEPYIVTGVLPWDEIQLNYLPEGASVDKTDNSRPNTLSNEEEMKRFSSEILEGDVNRIIRDYNLTGIVIQGSAVEAPSYTVTSRWDNTPSIILFLSLISGVAILEIYYRRRR